LSRTNALAYFEKYYLTAVKKFSDVDPRSEISHADALKTVLQNWVEEEEIKSVQVY
jgi:hypothetical protein